MKIFNRDNKINFVDDKNVFVGFDYKSCCCECFGYFLSKTKPNNLDCVKEDVDTNGFDFDTKFFEELSGDEYDHGGMVIFRLVKNEEEIFLCLYNCHNGYYSHGFEMIDGESITKYGRI